MYVPVSAARCEPNSCSWRNAFWKRALVNMPLRGRPGPPSRSSFLRFVLLHFPSAGTMFFCTPPHLSVSAFLSPSSFLGKIADGDLFDICLPHSLNYPEENTNAVCSHQEQFFSEIWWFLLIFVAVKRKAPEMIWLNAGMDSSVGELYRKYSIYDWKCDK